MVEAVKCCVLALVLVWGTAPAKAALRIEVLRGQGTNNNAATNRATTVVVRVWDANGPVPDALVVFTAPASGSSVVFSGSGDAGEAVTDESGTAVCPRLQPVGGNGPVSIRVMANKNGEFAQAVIHQMNLGLGESEARDTELDIVQLAAEPAVRVRVADGRGRPVARATLAFALRRLEKSGQGVELWRSEAVSDERGEALCPLPKRPGRGPLELEVRAQAPGARATRYFPLKH